MYKGDLANKVNINIGFKCVSLLLQEKNTTLKDKLINSISPAGSKIYEYNTCVKLIIEHIYWKTDYTVDLIIFKHEYTKRVKKMLEKIPYNRIIVVEKPSNITSLILSRDIDYYVDNDPTTRSLTNSNKSVTVNEIATLVYNRNRR